MGVFTDQVQGIVSEAKLKRLAKEQKEREKAKKEEFIKQLYFILSSYFTEADIIEYKNIYLNLLKDNTKWEIINEITKKEQYEYFLDINYMTILNKVKNNYMILYRELQKEEKEKQKRKKLQFQAYNLARLQQRKTFIEKRKNNPLLFFIHKL